MLADGAAVAAWEHNVSSSCFLSPHYSKCGLGPRSICTWELVGDESQVYPDPLRSQVILMHTHLWGSP